MSTVTIEKPPMILAPETINEMAVLCKAADIIERDGWCRNNFHSWGRHCAVGGMQSALKELGIKSRSSLWFTMLAAAKARMERVLAHYGRHSSVEGWNDSLSKDGKGVVLDMLRKAGDCATEL